MSGRSPAEAVQNFLDPLSETLGCVVTPVLQVGGGYHQAAEPHVLTIARGDPVPLRGSNKLALTIQHWYLVVGAEGERGPYKVSTAGYNYAVDDERGEVFAYQWHPHSPPFHPHLHFRRVADYPDVGKAHLPAGRVSIEGVVRLLIEAYAVEPLRPDWDEVLARSGALFDKWKTWG